MNYKDFKLAIIFDQILSVGGGYQQALNSALSLKTKNKYFSPIFFTIYSENIPVLEKYGIEVVYIKLSKFERAWLKFRALIISDFVLKYIQKFFGLNNFEKSLMDKNVDLVYFISPSSWSNYLEHLNYIITIWDLCHRDEPEFPEVYKNRIFERRELNLNSSLKRAIAIIVDSELGRENLVRRYLIDNSRIHIVPFSPATEIGNSNKEVKINIKEKFQISGDYIFYPAQFWAHKNHTYILKGIKVLKDKYNINVQAVFSGKDAGNLNYVKSVADALNLSDQVQFLGFVDNQDIIELYKGSIALVMPTYFGPTNIPPLEAFSLGVPVLYSNLPGLREQVGDSALLLDLNDPNSMAQNIINLMTDDILKANLIELGKKRIESINNINHNEIINLICSKYQIKMQTWKKIEASIK